MVAYIIQVVTVVVVMTVASVTRMQAKSLCFYWWYVLLVCFTLCVLYQLSFPFILYSSLLPSFF